MSANEFIVNHKERRELVIVELSSAPTGGVEHRSIA
jgi:hypothetical protein